jgi:hypothetical protein
MLQQQASTNGGGDLMAINLNIGKVKQNITSLQNQVNYKTISQRHILNSSTFGNSDKSSPEHLSTKESNTPDDASNG